MDYIVLVKQVPDISQITGNAFDPHTGTLLRSKLESTINTLDSQALAFANKMRQLDSDPKSKIVALTMGPENSQEVLRYSLARAADTAVLLSDKKLAGADTWATANALSRAIKKISAKILKSDNYFIITGMQSIDGDTAQVPPQIAKALDIPCISYACNVKLEHQKFQFEKIIDGGSEIATTNSTPAVITVANYDWPVFATFAKTYKANHAKVIRYTADDITTKHLWLEGSKTKVIKIFPPATSTRKCKKINNAKDFAKQLVQCFNSLLIEDKIVQPQASYIKTSQRQSPFDRTFEGFERDNENFKLLQNICNNLNIKNLQQINDEKKQAILDRADEHFHAKALDEMLAGLEPSQNSYNGDIWVIAEMNDSEISDSTFELIAKAKQLADNIESKVAVLLAGDKIKQKRYSSQLIAAGADTVYTTQSPLLEWFEPNIYCKAISKIINQHQPQIVLFSATVKGRVMAPMVAYQLDCGLTADCTALDIRDITKQKKYAILLQSRPALGGNIMATICTKDSPMQMATVRPGVFKKISPDENRTGQTIDAPVKLFKKEIALNLISTEKSQSANDFNAKVIISGGKGMRSRDSYETLITSLIDSLSEKLDTKVLRGASRAAIEQGFAERSLQIGQTGKSVAPDIYLAMGISGAIQHMIGIANSKNIFAVNNDPDSPIFKQCDYYIIGDTEKVIPEIVDLLKQEL